MSEVEVIVPVDAQFDNESEEYERTVELQIVRDHDWCFASGSLAVDCSWLPCAELVVKSGEVEQTKNDRQLYLLLPPGVKIGNTTYYLDNPDERDQLRYLLLGQAWSSKITRQVYLDAAFNEAVRLGILEMAWEFAAEFRPIELNINRILHELPPSAQLYALAEYVAEDIVWTGISLTQNIGCSSTEQLGFPRPGPGKDKQWPVDGVDRPFLQAVELLVSLLKCHLDIVPYTGWETAAQPSRLV